MISRSSIVIWKRCIATAPAKKSPLESTKIAKSPQVHISRLDNGLIVASLDRMGPVSRVAVAFKAGSRYETVDEQGVSHLLRNAIGRDSNSYSGIRLLWETGTAGANLTSSTTRDLFIVQADVIRDQANRALSLVGEMAGQPAFKEWELSEVAESLWPDLTLLHEQPGEMVVDMAHKAAFRSGPLGNSLFVHDFNVGKIRRDVLVGFASSRLVSGEAAVVGINVDHDDLVAYVTEQAPIVTGKTRPLPTSDYVGGEQRTPSDSSLAHVAIVGQGAGLSNPKSVATQAVLCSLLGVGPQVKYSSGGHGLVSLAVGKASSGYPFAASSLSCVHADTGLLGVHVVAHGERVGPMVTAAVDAFKRTAQSGVVDAAGLNRAKKVAATNILLWAEDSGCLFDDFVCQLLATGSTISPMQFVNLVQSVTLEDVQKAADKAVSKLSLAALGKIDATPYLDTL